jgi:hypothetical protein
MIRKPSAALLAGILALAGALPAAAVPAPEEEKKPETEQDGAKSTEAKPDESGKTVRVITNKDLEKYGEPRGAAAGPAAAAAPAPVPAPAPAPVPEGEILPPEERLDGTVTPEELVQREAELSELLAYLEAKEFWFKNPLVPAPEPPPGEDLLDAGRSGAEQLRDTRVRIDDTRRRLDTVRALLRATAPPPGSPPPS